MKKLLLILIGLPGSGKTTAADFLASQKIPVVRMGQITDEMLRKEEISFSEINENFIRQSLRKRYGDDIYASLTSPIIKELFLTHKVVVVDGLRAQSEYHFYLKLFKNLKLIFIESETKYRHRRLMRRLVRSMSKIDTVKRDRWEKEIGLVKLKKHADYLITNNKSKKEFLADLKVIIASLIDLND